LPAKLGRRRRRLFYIKSAAGALLLLAVFSGIVTLSQVDGLQVKNINISGNSAVIDADLITLAERIGSGKYLFFFPKTNIALFPRANVAAAIQENFPQISQVTVATQGLTNLDIGVIERTPVGLWCGRGASESQALTGRCYFLDEGGYIYSKAPDFSGPVFLRYYGLDGDPAPLRSQYLPPNTFRAMQLFLNGVRKLGLTPESFRLRDDVDYELWLDNGSKIFFSRNQDLNTVLLNLQSVVESDIFKGKADTLDYIDLRFGNKVYYKEK